MLCVCVCWYVRSARHQLWLVPSARHQLWHVPGARHQLWHVPGARHQLWSPAGGFRHQTQLSISRLAVFLLLVIDWRYLSIDTRNVSAFQLVWAVWIETADSSLCMQNKVFPWILLRQSDKILQRFSAKWKAMKPSGKNVESNWWRSNSHKREAVQRHYWLTFKGFLMRLPVCCLCYKDSFKYPRRLQTAACRIGHRKWEIEVAFVSLSPNTLRQVKVYDARVCAVGRGTALQAEMSRVRFPTVSLEFFIDIILPAALWPRGWFSL
jgi:hypothetical protein